MTSQVSVSNEFTQTNNSGKHLIFQYHHTNAVFHCSVFCLPLYSLISSRQNSVCSTKTAEIHRVFTYFDFVSSSHLFGPIFPPKLSDTQSISAQLCIIPKSVLRIRNSFVFLKLICNCSTCCSLPILLQLS